ncbi:hypothetical protein L484_006855 [Morus notabilis]|uniref:Uncharacterized protein n=1 Tax=Morus notabilis TaxID=981085 RepID=W9QXQ7_9ROSA|nr:hypothetical protein L484_006855 [Morus notabilis]
MSLFVKFSILQILGLLFFNGTLLHCHALGSVYFHSFSIKKKAPTPFVTILPNLPQILTETSIFSRGRRVKIEEAFSVYSLYPKKVKKKARPK